MPHLSSVFIIIDVLSIDKVSKSVLCRKEVRLMFFEQLNPHACRTYLIGNGDSVILVDPVIDHFDDYLILLKDRKLRLTHVIDTHTHADHITASPALKDAVCCEYIMHQNAPSRCVSLRVEDQDIFTLNEIEFRFLHTPGHSKDSICIIVGEYLLSGDTLFLDSGGAGRDDLPGGDSLEHWHSIERIRSLPQELILCPAHEYRNHQPSSLAQQRDTNPYFSMENENEYQSYVEDLRLGPAAWMKDILKANYTCAKDAGIAWRPVDLPSCEIKGTLEDSINAITVDSIQASTLRKAMQTDPQRYTLLDVREKHELTGELGKIDGALHIPIGVLSGRLVDLNDYLDEELVIICRSGSRAATAAQILIKFGFTKVLILENGMIGWNNSE